WKKPYRKMDHPQFLMTIAFLKKKRARLRGFICYAPKSYLLLGDISPFTTMSDKIIKEGGLKL
ncbi:hypothetical protein FRX31_021443, partial [Thalictrum thalictroides]